MTAPGSERSNSLQVLLVEDSPGDVRLTLEAFRETNKNIRLTVVADGVEAMAYLHNNGPFRAAQRPDLILLDLNLPKMDGREVLGKIKDDQRLSSIPTVILTTSDADVDVLKSYRLRANAYLRKPVRLEEFNGLIRSISDFWLTRARLPRVSTSSSTRVLLVEDNPGDARLLREMLGDDVAGRPELTHVTGASEAAATLVDTSFDIILLDLGLPDAQGLDAVRRIHAATPSTALVVLTGRDDASLASQALQEGAEDYLIKGQIDTHSIRRAIRYAIERKLMEEALFEEKERAQVTLNSIGDAIASTDVNGNITFLNLAAQEMTGWSWQAAEGRPLAEVFRIVDATTRLSIPLLATEFGQEHAVHARQNWMLLRRDGSELPIEDSVAPIRGRTGSSTGAVAVFRDVSAARAMSAEMTHTAHHDFLTGLPNRSLLNDRIDQAIALAPRHRNQVAVLFLDLDNFKHINDSLGHPTGDKLLQSIAGRLVECVRVSDTVSRQGGDEFVVLLSEAEQWQDAATVARRMLDSVAEAHTIDDHELHVTTSIGVSVFPDDGRDAETLIKNADTAMYQAKANGRQSFQFFKPAMNVRAVERQSIEEGLRRALERDEFVLHYQPKVNLESGAIIGAEALIRWTHPERGLIPPMAFIPIAEDSGLIRPIGEWVRRRACDQVRAWSDAGLPRIAIAVNVSAMELRDDNFVTRVFATLDEAGLDPRLLEVEVTESILMTHADSAASILQSLREHGAQVAVDDFGTGYSSLSYLRKFPIDALKIDQSFVREITEDGNDTSIVTAVISMAKSLGLRVIAEGVETPEQLAFLQSHECDEGQGYYFSRAVAADEFARMLVAGIPSPAGDMVA
jgi:diguanylate cyclase (GGDEF)-like protein/PAS domain S-box-containing protein